MTAATRKALASPKVYPDQVASTVTSRVACAFCGCDTVRQPGDHAPRVLCGWDAQTFTFDANGRLVTWEEMEGAGEDEGLECDEAA